MARSKCPKCNNTLSSVSMEPMAIKQPHASWKGVSYFCPSCQYVLSVSIRSFGREERDNRGRRSGSCSDSWEIGAFSPGLRTAVSVYPQTVRRDLSILWCLIMSKIGKAKKKIIHFYCYTCKAYELKTSPHYRSQKRRFAKRREGEGEDRKRSLARNKST